MPEKRQHGEGGQIIGGSKNAQGNCHWKRGLHQKAGCPRRLQVFGDRGDRERKKDGQVVRSEMKLFYTDYTDDISYRFPKYETAFRYHRCIADGFIGNAPTQLCDARKMKETVELIFKNSDGADPLFDEKPIPQKWYCLT